MINNKEQIIEYFKSGIKNSKDLKIGIEHEKFLFNNQNNKRIDYSKINEMFSALLEFGWNPILEKNNIIGLNKGGKNITLEPGNQIELSGEKLNNIHEACAESHDYLFELKQVSNKLNISIVSAGFDPISKLNEIPNNPKRRYKLMTKDMPAGGELSLDMMYRTCGTQLNIDYNSEEDFIKKFKIVNSIVPISIALFANSSIVEKKKSNYLSYRSKIWQSTSRGGLPDIFLEEMDFEKYADFSLNFNLLFLLENNSYNSGNGKNFQDLINEQKGNSENFQLHLSTIFTELRLKKYIELRSIDACEWDCHCASPAFFTGLLYGALDETYDLIKNWNKLDIKQAYTTSYKDGLNVMINEKNLLFWSKELLKISKKGLEKRSYLNHKKNNETVYLKNIENILLNNLTKAQQTLKDF